ncbi:hypothetical protein [Xylanimonas protaetiae]|uniref:Uncharacterized protein n=1 Tax=Xylanimonas protaetiae TaxID=2509457 RepID=A0A4P6F3K7_9MICO|nr:hypothetical protein [Xylanimonas protaetiae]QAY69886.1 hypothetical protein ET471_07435 [Xylanimonas protaetiae]
MSPRTVSTDQHARRGRLAKARQFAEAAEIVHALAGGQADLLDAYDLDVLLGMKTQAGYGHEPVTPERAVRSGRAMDALLVAAGIVG